MRTAPTWADEIASILIRAAPSMPKGFFCSFDYTSTGSNLCHPVTWGSLVRNLALQVDEHVGIDVRLNDNAGTKFQPDIVVFDTKLDVRGCIDYESPNSSDARVPYKDIDVFQTWQEATGSDAPYVVITTLPDAERPAWELRYTSAGKWNEEHKGYAANVRLNPLRYWRPIYEAAFDQHKNLNIAWVNLSELTACRLFPV